MLCLTQLLSIVFALNALGSAAAAAAAAAGRTCTSCKGPIHSWKTLPVSFHCAERSGPHGGFTDSELKVAAKFPLVTLEKWEGVNSSEFLWEEDAWVTAATQIKKANPKASVNVWFDSMRIYTGWFYPAHKEKDVNHTLNPDARHPCSTGHYRAAEFLEKHEEFLLKNKTGQPALESYGSCHVFDFTKSQPREYWKNMCLNITASGVIDGCGADASWQNGWDQRAKWGLDDKTAKAWETGHKQMMRETMAALGDGLIIGKDPWELGDYVSGALHEGCKPVNKTINTLQNLTQHAAKAGKRYVYQCHTNCKSAAACIPSVAAFLIGAGVDQYFVTGGWNAKGSFDSHWIAELFEPALGEPTADGKYDASTATWTRSFSSGTKVTFNAHTNNGTINWATT